jgi:hypothetical protein
MRFIGLFFHPVNCLIGTRELTDAAELPAIEMT